MNNFWKIFSKSPDRSSTGPNSKMSIFWHFFCPRVWQIMMLNYEIFSTIFFDNLNKINFQKNKNSKLGTRIVFLKRSNPKPSRENEKWILNILFQIWFKKLFFFLLSWFFKFLISKNFGFFLIFSRYFGPQIKTKFFKILVFSKT